MTDAKEGSGHVAEHAGTCMPPFLAPAILIRVQ
jgi:hypothetical protein